MALVDLARSRIILRSGDKESAVTFTGGARFGNRSVPSTTPAAAVALVAGPQTTSSIRNVDLRSKAVLYVPEPGLDAEARQAFIQQLWASSKGVVVLNDVDSATFARQMPLARQEPVSASGKAWTAHVRTGAIRQALTAAQIDLAQAKASAAAIIKDIPDLTVQLEVVSEPGTAPNTVGILEGSDPKLKDEYIVFSAHMDHIGVKAGQLDSINNGADDDGSGTVGVVELAEAFSRPGARPKRSIIFLTVSGEEKGLWGSRFFSENPVVPIEKIVADINLDMIGRNWKDTIVAIGKEHSDLGATLNRVVTAHPELRMAAIDDIWPSQNFYSRSDHYNFARKGVPILFFFSGVHEDYHQPSDSPDKLDAEKEARVLRLIFYLGQEVANADERPKWNEESYKRIVKGGA